MVTGFLTAWFLAFFRFFLPRTLFEPNSVFKIGYPSDFALGVDTKFQQKYRIWVERNPERIFVIYARCTHLGCTPDWKPSENKFKCPCHGSGYDSEGINFEGPAPRPMDRAHVELDPDGQIVVDTSQLVLRGPRASRASSTIRAHSCRSVSVHDSVVAWPNYRRRNATSNRTAWLTRTIRTAGNGGRATAAERKKRQSRAGRPRHDGVKEDIQALKTDIPAKAKEQIEGLKARQDPGLHVDLPRQARRDARATARWACSPTSSCTCIPPRSIATPCATTTPGAWAASLSICSSC